MYLKLFLSKIEVKFLFYSLCMFALILLIYTGEDSPLKYKNMQFAAPLVSLPYMSNFQRSRSFRTKRSRSQHPRTLIFGMKGLVQWEENISNNAFY